MLLFLLNTFIFYRPAKLIRSPIFIRGRRFIAWDRGLVIGYNVRIDAFDFYNSQKKIINFGENVQINDNVHIAGIRSVDIGSNVLIASRVFISDHDHGNYSDTSLPHSKPEEFPKLRELYSKPVKIGNNVWIGENVSILKGVCVGDGAIIGANSVVLKNVQRNSMVAGSPAKVIRKFNPKKQMWIKI
ncbi:WbbJ Acetyltransferase (isoleucine patch superfamily) [Candidatus Methylopumilus planktonicus]|uniref:DapH/DapD/GlmU-related protein n=1 Tax=Candidatus Methylopumilus planktonicus TaxID=1581557 RepID=UPI003BEF029C